MLCGGDSTTIISWGRGDRCASWRLHHFISQIRTLIKESDIYLIHVSRSQNDLVDKVAKWSVGQLSSFEGNPVPAC